jgi:capsular polysaccharide export protein
MAGYDSVTVPVILPLLRIPPFPNAPTRALAQPGAREGARLADDEVNRIAAAIAEAKVGGTFWGSQPPVPDIPYTLVRVADAGARLDVISSAGDRPTVVWTEPTPGKIAGCPRSQHVGGIADPWHLLGGAAEVIVDADDELALLAALAGVPVTCIGSGRFASLGNGGAPALREALRSSAIDAVRYTDPFTGAAVGIEDALRLCGFWRQLIDANRQISAAVGFAFWKRPTVAPLLWGGTGRVPFVSRPKPTSTSGHIAVWKTRTATATLARLEASGARLVEVEDGFIRSAGLGADCVPPLSIIVDQLGVYFDPSRPSELERLLEVGEFEPDILDRARRLRALIVELGVSKYGAGGSPLVRRAPGKRHLLVPGQVEDDRSVVCGGGAVTTNLELLRRVREANPDAWISYKPHPDVEAGHRRGTIPDELCLALADEIVRTGPISSLIDIVDEVHVNTSLAGFEALLRGKPVTTYGVPFYAGWGLTSDLGSVPARRTARRSLDELVAATLLLYPRYLDPVTGLPCPPEILIRRLAEGGVGEKGGPVVRLRRWQGRINRAASRVWQR